MTALRAHLWSWFVLLVGAAPAAQERSGAPATAGPAGSDADAAASLVTLRAVLESMDGKRAEIAELEREAAAAASEPQKLQVLAERSRARDELLRLQTTFDGIAAGIDLDTHASAAASFDLVGELEKLVRPLIDELKDITAEPRQLSQLRSDLQRERARHDATQRGLERVRRLQAATTTASLREALTAVEERWQRRAQDARNVQTVLQHRLDEKERERRSLYESTRSFFGGFFRERGLNLLLAVGAFVAVFVGLRWAYRPLTARLTPSHQRRFAFRLFAVSYHVAVVLLAVAAALLVLYAAGDWILLGLVLLLLFGVIWAGKQTLPRFIEQISMALNLGSVRESERVVFDGLPWRVEAIHWSVHLVNPALTGGVLRLPSRRLLGMYSRPSSADEPWFPSREGDWVAVGSVRGQVVQQTPETVQVAVMRTRVTYRTLEYLAANPTNLSQGFTVGTTFGIDYRHQAIATTEVPAVMRAAAERALRATLGEEQVVAVRVEFQAASASSLDYTAAADLRGTAAPSYDLAVRTIQRALVDVCNERGWSIPFPQLTVHQAAG
jgi:hypothetical protein